MARMIETAADGTTILNRAALRAVAAGSADIATEASTAGLPVGSFPLVVAVPGRFGELVRFERNSILRDRDGDVLEARYTAGVRRSPAWVQRVTLRIVND